MTDHIAKYFRSPLSCLAVSGALVLLSRLLQLPLTTYTNPAVAWALSLLLGAVFSRLSVLIGIFLGYVIAGFCPIVQPPETISFLSRLGLDTITAACIILSTTFVIQKKCMPVFGFYAVMAMSLIVLGGLVCRQPDIKIAFIFFAAALITGLLCCIKNTSLNNAPSLFFGAWLPGYIAWVALVWFLSLDPSIAERQTLFQLKYLLIPFSVYILLILIISHIFQWINRNQ